LKLRQSSRSREQGPGLLAQRVFGDECFEGRPGFGRRPAVEQDAGPGLDRHDMGDPASTATHVRDTLHPDGTWMTVEPYALSQQAERKPGQRAGSRQSPAAQAPRRIEHDSMIRMTKITHVMPDDRMFE
jgi:hypothetical protein